jgi:two-component system response regulator YesN
MRAALVKLLVILGRARARSLRNPAEHPIRNEVWAVLQEVERCIQCGEVVDVAGLAQDHGLSPEYLSRMFRRAVGLSVMPYFQRRRLHVAARLLLQGAASATDVAHQLGFADYSHFRRMFRRTYGASPARFRQRNGVTGAA